MRRWILSLIGAAVWASAGARTVAPALREAADEPKEAILVVSFGTSHDDTRAVTIDALREAVAAEFPGVEVREAYTSNVIRRILRKRGIEKPDPRTALLRLAADGYDWVAILSTNLLDGKETELLRAETEAMRPFFGEIRLSEALLHDLEDCRRLLGVMTRRLEPLETRDTHVVLVGHGSPTMANAVYSQLDHLLQSGGFGRYHVATIEGYPTPETVLARLKEARARRVVLVPLLLVAGDHAKNDIGTEWRELFEQEGFRVEVRMEGLGEVPEIRRLYIEHLRHAMQ